MKQLIINQSLVKKFFYKGVVRDYCPYCIYCENIAKTHNRQTESMTEGSYFETLCLGSGVRGNITNDLPRKKLTSKQILAGQTLGDKKINQIRLEKQHLNFQRLCGTYQINVQKEVNTQVRIIKRWINSYFPNEEIYIEGELDIFPTTILLPKRGLRLAVIDLKATGKFDTFGEFCWADPENLDKTQGWMYNELIRDIDIELNLKMYPDSKLKYLYTGPIKQQLDATEPLFFFWVFNYKEELKNKIIEVLYDNKAKEELHESIRKTVEEILKNQRKGWTNVNPTYDNCKMCAVTECKNKIAFKPVKEEHQSFQTI